MRHPILLALGAGLLVLLVAFAAPLWQLVEGTPTASKDPAAPDLPWQAKAQPDGTLQVFGLVLGRDTLADARVRIGDGLQVALVARLGEVGQLEALADPFGAGFVTGRLVLAFDVAPQTLRRWRERAIRSTPMDDGVRRFDLQVEDRDEALRASLAGLSFVPSLRLTEADLRQRFGAPVAEVGLADGAKVLLYPALGLAATVGQGSRGVLEYVAPGDFEARLRAPLAASAPAAVVASAPG
jgi:hypothetical protein